MLNPMPSFSYLQTNTIFTGEKLPWFRKHPHNVPQRVCPVTYQVLTQRRTVTKARCQKQLDQADLQSVLPPCVQCDHYYWLTGLGSAEIQPSWHWPWLTHRLGCGLYLFSTNSSLLYES